MKKLVITFSVLVIMLSCDNKPKEKFLTDTPTSGTINALVDETYKPLMDSEKMVFESSYPDAKINLIYAPQADVLASFDVDSIRMFVTAVPFDSSLFEKFYKEKEFLPPSSVIAKDAVAVIANNQRKGMQITVDELKKICNGEINDFSQLRKGMGGGKIKLVFDNSKSSTVQYLQDSILKGGSITSNAFAQKNNPEVISYVKDNKDALGVIGVNWISDAKDDENIEFSKFIFPVDIAENASAIRAYPPHPSYVSMGVYPLTRSMIATVKESYPALGTGFINFMSGEIGQRIVLKAGLVPAKVVTRVVELKKTMD